MNEKSKDTAKARQDLKKLGIRSGLWLGQTKNGKCSKPQQICSQTLMEADMLKAQSKVVDILCNLELIYPHAFFDIMIHLVIHLPIEALEGGPIRPEEALTFSSHYFREMSAYVARGHDGDGGGDDRPPTHHIPTGCGGCFANRGKGTRKPNLGGRKAGRLHTRQETRNLGLKKITDDKGPVPIRFEWDDKKTMMPLGDHASHWSNYLGELIREMPLYYPSWQKVPAERKAAILTKIGTQFDLKPHMQSQRWTYINAGIQQHLQKLYNTNKASLKATHWVINPETGTHDVESIMTRLPFRMISGTKPVPLKIAKTGQRAQWYADMDVGHLIAFEIRW
ncbi:RNA-directed DNA polymerase, eukaryota [Tanacetum coccineum]